MPQFSIALAELSDFEAILALQGQNHLSQLSEASLGDGFVTTQLTPQTLESMRANAGLWVARNLSGELMAYACSNDWNFYGESPFPCPLIDKHLPDANSKLFLNPFRLFLFTFPLALLAVMR